MKQLVCEMCGGHDLVKQDGIFVCQNCGTKYSVEEAKKMMVEGTVSVKGTVEVEGKVAVDKTKDVDKLFVLARREKESGDKWKARRYYSQIEELDPSNWEAYFYTLYYDAICSSDWEDHEKYRNGISAAFELLTNSTDKKTELEAAIKMMSADMIAMHKISKYHHTAEVFGDNIIKFLPQFSSYALKIWKKIVKDYLKEHEKSVERDYEYGWTPDTLSEKIELDSGVVDFDIRECVKKIQKFDSAYQNPLHEYEHKDKKIKQDIAEAEELAQSQANTKRTTNIIWIIVLLMSIGCVAGSLFLESGKLFWFGLAGIIGSILTLALTN